MRVYNPESEAKMKCDQCGTALADVHLTKINNGVQTERHLCLACASEQAGLGPNATFKEIFKKLTSEDGGRNPD